MTIKGQTPPAAAPTTAMGTAFSTARQAAQAVSPPQAAPAPQQAMNQQSHQPTGQPLQRPATANERPGAFSFRNLRSIVNAPMGRTPAGEVISKLQKALELTYVNIGKDFEVTVLPMDYNQNPVLSISALVVCVRSRTNPDLGVGYHTLILEGSIEPLQARIEQVNGQQVRVQRVAGDANNARMIDAVANEVSRAFPTSRIYNADSCVVPADFDLTSEDLVYALASNAALAASMELERARPDFLDMNLVNASRDETLTVRPIFMRETLSNEVGQPLRSDFAVDLTAAANNQAGQDQIERTTLVARINGFADLIWDPVAPQGPVAYGQQAYGQAQPGPVPTQLYQTRLVLTRMEAAQALTMGTELLTLVTALSLGENNVFVQTFRPTSYGSNADINDFGAVGLEASFTKGPDGRNMRIDTKSDSFNGQLPQLAAAVLRPGIVLSLDVEECGPSTWYNGAFAAAASGHQGANDMILNACNELTNGAFAKYFSSSNGRVAIDENNRIHLGYYIDEQGVKRDIREIGYLQVLNILGEKDEKIMRDWSDTFQKPEYDLRLRLEAREKIITGIFPSAKVTGFARRVTFENAFTSALAAGCADCGLDIRQILPYQDAGSYARATARFTNETLITGSAGIFNRSAGQYQGGSIGGRSFGGRWN